MKKILVPCDFSDASVEALQFAIDLASKNGSSISVLKVIDFPIVYETSLGMSTYALNANLMKELEDDAESRFKKMIGKYAKGFSKIKLLIAHGPTSAMISDCINDKKMDLVVMGTQGAAGMKEFFVGSNTEKVVRLSKAPVFAIRKAVPVSSIKNIVYPTSLQLNESDFIKKLKSIQEFFGATLHILFLNTPFNFVTDNNLKDYAKHYKFTNFTLNIRHDRYEPDGILSFTKEIKADMLAMATHGRKGLSHFVSGSITEDVVNHAQYPIWTYILKK